MPLLIRRLVPDDARAFLEVHHAAVRGTAADDYPASVIDAWAPEILDAHVERVKTDRGGIKLVAVFEGNPAGIGEVALGTGELRACYVAPAFDRKGIGRAIVNELEAIARSESVSSLWLDSSITAQAFYEALGYTALEQGEHILGSGVRMACIKMTKRL